ncbi:hypothetical protein NDI49_24065 [Trichocoleus sp. ST-U3]
MTTDAWFDDLPMLGQMPPAQAAAKLREVGEDEVADAIENAQFKVTTDSTKFGILEDLGFRPQLWLYSSHIFGYSVPEPNKTALSIQSASDISADHTLKNTRIEIILKHIHVEAYPGGGTHHILFNFQAQNQLTERVETLNFTTTHRVREGKEVAIIDQPIFTALNVGIQGVAFHCVAVNVKNEEDERILKWLQSPFFSSGLTLITMPINQLIAPVSELGIALVSLLANRYKNLTAQNFEMGLDFGTDPRYVRLAEGDYIAVQTPESMKLAWDWDEWVYDPSSGQVVNDYDRTELIPYNYIIFSVNRYEET